MVGPTAIGLLRQIRRRGSMPDGPSAVGSRHNRRSSDSSRTNCGAIGRPNKSQVSQPHGTDLSRYSQAELNRIALRLANGRAISWDCKPSAYIESQRCAHLLNPPPRTLRRRSCQVRMHEDAAPPISLGSALSGPGGAPKRLLGVVESATVKTRPGEGALGGGDPGGTCADQAEIRTRVTPS